MAKKDAASLDADADAARDADAANADDAAEIVEDLADIGDDEVFEIEVDEDDIYAYIVDEDDNEIGFILLDENGVEQEYYYVEDDKPEDDKPEDEKPEDEKTEDAKSEEKQGRFSKETYEVVEEATENINAIYKDGSEIASEFKGAVDDISSGFEFFKPSR